jgi:pimeloyl-ACP methyl ester carboxylesterase
MRRTFLPALAVVAVGFSAQSHRDATAQPTPAYTSGFIDSGDARIYYLDHGGMGLPVILDSYTGDGLPARLIDRYRVVVITLHRKSDAAAASGAEAVAREARELLDVLDAFGFDRAVLVTGFYPRAMTYLAEHHPGRLAGLVYLTGAPEMVDYIELDPTGGYPLLIRALPREFQSDIVEAMDYRPRYLSSSAPMIRLPALALTPGSGELSPGFDLLTYGASVVNLPFFRDAEARAYFERLAEDETLRARVAAFQDEVVGPRAKAHEQAFRRAFGEHLRVQSIDIPRLTPPAFRSSPELIYAPVEHFLDDIRARTPRPAPVRPAMDARFGSAAAGASGQTPHADRGSRASAILSTEDR